MKWDHINTQTCSIAKASSVFGDRWTLLIVRELFLGIRRFSDIHQSLGITKHRLTDRLNRLMEENIVFRHLYDENYNRYEYRLTEKGLELYPILITLAQWGDKWMSDEDGIPVEYIHTGCGQIASPRLACSCCGEALTLDNLKMTMGPGLKQKQARDAISETDKKLYGRLMDDQTQAAKKHGG